MNDITSVLMSFTSAPSVLAATMGGPDASATGFGHSRRHAKTAYRSIVQVYQPDDRQPCFLWPGAVQGAPSLPDRVPENATSPWRALSAEANIYT